MSIKYYIDRGLLLREQIAVREKELKEIEGHIQELGLQHTEDHVDLKDADREGRQWLAQGTDKVVPVIFTADKIIGSFKDGSAQHQTIRTALNGRVPFSRFFRSETTWSNLSKTGKAFRAFAVQMLGTECAPAFITACTARDKHGIAKSDIKINWDDAEAVTAVKR